MVAFIFALAFAPAIVLGCTRAFLSSSPDTSAHTATLFKATLLGVLCSIFGAIASMFFSILGPPLQGNMLVILPGTSGPLFAVGIYIDRISAIMWTLVSVISWVVVAFSHRYLDGEARQRYFLQWLAITISSVQAAVISSNLGMFFVAWLVVSFGLHHLLTFYPERPRAISCARQKFVVSRIGDLFILSASVLLARHLGTLEFASFAPAVRLLALQGESGELSLITVLFALGALTKSAQLPFQAWLPQSLETPTPVSALMHAGIINGGGFLLLRVSPLFSEAHAASVLLAVVGGVTALYGMSVMVTQTSIKARLAYSTIGQMGFMIMQCGLGLYGLALLHIVAHGFYKAYAFLRAGSALDQAREQSFFPERHAYSPLAAALFVVLIASGGVVALHYHSEQLVPLRYVPVLVVWALALCHLGWGIASVRRPSVISVSVGVSFAATLLATYALLSHFLVKFINPSVGSVPATPLLLVLFLVALFGIGFVFQICGKTFTRFRLGRALHIHIHNGLYFEALSARMIQFFEKRERRYGGS